jgi:hypothetical protein
MKSVHIICLATCVQQSILNRRDQWATLHEAQVYLTRRQMYADLDPRVLKAFWPHALKEMKDLHGNTRVFLQPRAQIEVWCC